VSKKVEPSGILFVGYFLSQHGRGRCVCEDLSIRFHRKKYRVVNTSSSTNRFIRLLDILMTIIRYRNEYQIAFVEVYNGLAFVWAELACSLLRALGKPYIITLHGARLISFSERWPVRVRKLIQEADVVTTPSKIFQNKFSSLREDIVYLPNAIDINSYLFKQRNKPDPKLGWLRKFEENYNPSLTINVHSLLSKEFPTSTLSMGGADGHDGSFEIAKSLVIKEGLTEKIDFPGFINRSQISHWFSKSDIYLNTTNVESFGIAVLEAAACGLCIVTTNVGELPYIWEDGVDALLVPPNDPEAMAAAVRRILTEPGLAARLSANARKKAERYDWSVVLPMWESLLNNLIEHETP